MGKVIGILLIGFAASALTDLLAVGVLLLASYLKMKFDHMEEADWIAYFHRLSIPGMGLRLAGCYVVALCILAPMVYGVYRLFDYRFPGELTFVFVLLFTLYHLLEVVLDRKNIREKLMEIHKIS